MSGEWQGGLIAGAGSILGAGINAAVQADINKKNYEMQKEFAQNSLQWKVEDAKKAGLHPLAAVGAQGYSANPSFVGSNVGEGIASFGSKLGGAIQADARLRAKDDAEMRKLQLENQQLQNDLLRKQVQSKTTRDVVDEILPKATRGTDAIPNATPTKPAQLLQMPNADRNSLAKPDPTKQPSKALAVDANDWLTKTKPNLEMSHAGNGILKVTPNADGLAGQNFSEGFFAKPLTYLDTADYFTRNNWQALKQIEAEARRRGVLTSDKPYYNLSYNYMGGIDLVPSKTRNLGRFLQDTWDKLLKSGDDYLKSKEGKELKRRIKDFFGWK